MKPLRIPLGVSGALVLGLAIAFAFGTFAGTDSPASSASAAGGPSETVGVRGAWAIDIVDPDGTVARHVEFHNDLTLAGAEVIARALAREVQVGLWSIQLVGESARPSPCQGEIGVRCFILEPGHPFLEPGPILNSYPDAVFDTLDVRGGAGHSVLLRGSAIVGFDGAFEGVLTVLGSCAETCLQAEFVEFSSAALSPAASVVAGQQIEVTVEFSFVTVP